MGSFVVNTAVALDGSGTQEEPWLIQSLEDFNDFAADANYWDDHTRLETDVNLAGMVYERAVIAWDVNSAWPFQGTKYTGIFDGNDHKIINLTIDDGGAGNDYLGLFGCIDGGEVMNLGLEGGFVSGEYRVGGLVGGNFGIVSNCYYTGDISGDWQVGGLVGINGFVVYFPTLSAKVGYIYNSYSTGSVSGDQYVGGLVGLVIIGDVSNCCSISDVNGNDAGGLVGVNCGIVSNCSATGDVSGSHEVGGLVGRNGAHSGGYPGTDPGYIHNSYSTGAVQGNSRVGGLVGENCYGTVSNCYSTGYVSGDYDVGGLVGQNGILRPVVPGRYLGYILISYSTSAVQGYSHVGGLVGYNNGSISNCYSIGDVNGVSDVGGLVGLNSQGCISNNSFWDTDTQTHGVTESIGLNDGDVNNVEGLPTAQMQTRSTFTDANWDFINIWDIGENQTYPYLRVYMPSDINKDRIVNFLDFAITANQWMEEQ